MKPSNVRKLAAIGACIAAFVAVEILVVARASAKTDEDISIPVSEGIPKDSEMRPDGSYRALSNDPWIEFTNIDRRISRILLKEKNSVPGAMGQVFLSYASKPGYSEARSISFTLEQRTQKEIEIPVDSVSELRSIRLDYSNAQGDNAYFGTSIVLRSGTSVLGGRAARIVLYAILTAIIALILFMPKAIRSGTIARGVSWS
jgi:hypothetical protein